MKTQKEKGEAFRALHARSGAFVIPNPWDLGTARMLERLGFEALATTSAGYAFSVGKQDNTPDRMAVMQHLAEISAATDLPVSADLGNGFGDAPEIAAAAIRLAADAGVVGGSIEDATGHADHAIYEHTQAGERVKAAAEAARRLPFPFTLTARAENYLNGQARPEGHDQTLATLSGGGGGCSLCSRTHEQRGYPRGGEVGGSARECAGGIARNESDG